MPCGTASSALFKGVPSAFQPFADSPFCRLRAMLYRSSCGLCAMLDCLTCFGGGLVYGSSSFLDRVLIVSLQSGTNEN